MNTPLSPRLNLSVEEWQQEALRRAYQKCPDLYSEDVLGVQWWSKQNEIAQALLKYKRVLVRAGNGPGKSFLAAGLVNWFYDTHNPSRCISSAPTQSQVEDVLWAEIRKQRKGRGGLLPKAPRMESAPDHLAVGYTSNTPEAFQGRHSDSLFIIFDEATAIDPEFYVAANGMQPLYWLLLLNPTDTSSRAYEEEQSGRWHVIALNSFEHPNIEAEMAGLPPPYPECSLRLQWLRDRVNEWCTSISAEDKRAADFEFEGGIYRPGPLFESRVFGRWPSAGSNSVWSEAIWLSCLKRQELETDEPLIIGCDVARHGSDFTSILARRGACALHHETHNGWSTDQTAGRLKQLCKLYAQKGESPTSVNVHIDDDGVGGGVVDQKGEHSFRGVSGSHKALTKDYRNKRSESWFAVCEKADEGNIDLSRLSDTAKSLIHRQVMAPKWKVDQQGRREVEAKADTKKRLGRSPDDADALNLAYAPSRRAVKVLKWGS